MLTAFFIWLTNKYRRNIKKFVRNHWIEIVFFVLLTAYMFFFVHWIHSL